MSSSSNGGRNRLLRRIFKAMDTRGDGTVQFAEVTKIIAMAHASGSTGRLATPRGGSGLPSARTRPSNAVALELPEAFTLNVWLANGTRVIE